MLAAANRSSNEIAKEHAKLNEFKTIEAAPFISKKGVTMVPLRFISEAFKADVAWDPVFKSVTLTLGGKIMRVQVGFLTADVNGKPFALQDAPVIVKGRTFCPPALHRRELWRESGLERRPQDGQHRLPEAITPY